ncbi:hypothetical protein BH23CHL8_BH23CHL8_13660 [soil metagenome]
MDGVAEALGTFAPWLAVVALTVGLVALALGLRNRRGEAIDPVSGSRLADSERRVAQLAHRLDVLEDDMDARRAPPRGGEADRVAGPGGRSGPALSHVGLVRFDAFEDTGGGQSFTLALIDDEGDGVVLTSLHSRQVTRMYVKGIRGGVADVALSGEEEQALREAGLAS